MRALFFFLVVLLISCNSDEDGASNDIDVNLNFLNQDGIMSNSFSDNESIYLRLTVINKTQAVVSYEIGTFMNPQELILGSNENSHINLLENANVSFGIIYIDPNEILEYWIPIRNVVWDQSNQHFSGNIVPTLSNEVSMGTFNIELKSSYAYSLSGENRVSQKFDLRQEFTIN